MSFQFQSHTFVLRPAPVRSKLSGDGFLYGELHCPHHEPGSSREIMANLPLRKLLAADEWEWAESAIYGSTRPFRLYRFGCEPTGLLKLALACEPPTFVSKPDGGLVLSPQFIETRMHLFTVLLESEVGTVPELKALCAKYQIRFGKNANMKRLRGEIIRCLGLELATTVATDTESAPAIAA